MVDLSDLRFTAMPEVQSVLVTWSGSFEAISGVCSDSRSEQFLRALMGAAPFHSRLDRRLPEDRTDASSYPLVPKATRSYPTFIPSGRLTCQVRRDPSTCSSMVARVGGWSAGESTKRKSGPICTMRKLLPLNRSRIRTNAECPP